MPFSLDANAVSCRSVSYNVHPSIYPSFSNSLQGLSLAEWYDVTSGHHGLCQKMATSTASRAYLGVLIMSIVQLQPKTIFLNNICLGMLFDVDHRKKQNKISHIMGWYSNILYVDLDQISINSQLNQTKFH